MAEDHGLFSAMYPTLLFVLVVTLGVTQLILLLVARSGETPGRGFTRIITLLSILAPLAVITLMVLGVASARARLIEVLTVAVDPARQATLLSSCGPWCVINGQLLFGSLGMIVTGFLGGLGVLTCWLRGARSAGRALASTMGPGLGLALMLLGGGLIWIRRSLEQQILERVAGMALTAKLPLLREIYAAAGRKMSWLLLAVLAILAASTAMALLAARRQDSGRRAGSWGLAAGIAALVVGGILFGLTRPHAADLRRPVPLTDIKRIAPHRDIELPTLPNAAPLSDRPFIVTIGISWPAQDPGGGIVTLEGSEVATARELLNTGRGPWAEITRLRERLEVYRDNWKLTHPDRPHPGLVSLMAHKKLDAGTLRPVVASCVAAGYTRLNLISSRASTLRSAVLGELKTREQISVSARLSTRDSPGAIKIHPGTPYGDLARRIALAGAGRAIFVERIVKQPPHSPGSAPSVADP